MKRFVVQTFVTALALVAAAAVSPVRAHFVFVVPEPGATQAKMILSETLEPDGDVEVAPIGKTSLALRQAGKPDAKLDITPGGEHALLVKLPGDGPRVIHGSLDYGVEKRGGKVFLLAYHPKTVLGDPFEAKTALGDAAAAEIIATGKPGEVVFQVLSRGKPAAAAKITVLPPGGKEQVLETDKDGRTIAFKETGRFGAWARCVETVSGEHGGEKYDEVRRYPTLVIDVGGAARAAAQAKPGKSGVSSANIPSTRFPALPEAVSSFGAAAAGDWLYVYGGHTAPTHHYDTDAVSGKFHRIKLVGGTAWESLQGGPGLQGMNIVAHGENVYRVGGMQPRNKPGDKEDNYSIADVTRFDPKTLAWTPLPSLPEPRSSHDVVVVRDKLIVVGGWNMKGHAAGNEWPATAMSFDLKNPQAKWETIHAPFQRRALIATVHQGKVYVIGGFDEHDDPTVEVQVLDPAINTWTKGPQVPTRDRHGFAPAACSLDGKLYVSVMDGTMYRLADDGQEWTPVAKTTPRIVHRLVPHAGQILVLGGADRGGNFDLVEIVKPAPGTAPVVESRAE